MKATTIESLLDHVNAMEHRERISLRLTPEAVETCGAEAYALEVYVTFPFENCKLSGGDQNRVLFQVVTVDGKNRKEHAKTSCKRSDLRTDRGALKMAFGLVIKS
jgi:hypothetical protein